MRIPNWIQPKLPQILPRTFNGSFPSRIPLLFQQRLTRCHIKSRLKRPHNFKVLLNRNREFIALLSQLQLGPLFGTDHIFLPTLAQGHKSGSIPKVQEVRNPTLLGFLIKPRYNLLQMDQVCQDQLN